MTYFIVYLISTATATPADEDGDGWTVEEGDCDDTLRAIHPGAVEVCDGWDNDCDGVVDEGVRSRWWVEIKGMDGCWSGEPTRVILACDQPYGTVPRCAGYRPLWI